MFTGAGPHYAWTRPVSTDSVSIDPERGGVGARRTGPTLLQVESLEIDRRLGQNTGRPTDRPTELSAGQAGRQAGRVDTAAWHRAALACSQSDDDDDDDAVGLDVHACWSPPNFDVAALHWRHFRHATCCSPAWSRRMSAVIKLQFHRHQSSTDHRRSALCDTAPFHLQHRLPIDNSLYTSLFTVQVEKKHTRKHTTRKIEKKHKNTYLTVCYRDILTDRYELYISSSVRR